MKSKVANSAFSGTESLLDFCLVTFFIVFFLANSWLFACESGSNEEKYFGVLTGFPSDEITSIISDKLGNIYVGTEDKGIVVIASNSESFSHIIDTKQKLTFNAVTSMAISEDEKLWVGTAAGLNGVDLSSGDSSNVRIRAEDGLEDNTCLAVTTSANGSQIWVGTTKGLVLKSAFFERFTTDDQLLSNYISALQFDPDNVLWIGTSMGLMKRSGFKFSKVELTEEDTSVEKWVYDLSMTTQYELDYQKKTINTLKAIVKGAKNRDKRLIKGIENAHKRFIEFVLEMEKRLKGWLGFAPLYVATNTGCFIIDRSSGIAEKIRDGWHTSVAAGMFGGGVAGGRDLVVHPLGLDESIAKPFDLKPKLIGSILLILEGYAGLSREEKEQMLPEETLKLLEQLGDETSEDRMSFADKLLAGKTVSALCYSPLGHLWVGVKGGGVFRFKPIIANHDSLSWGISNFNSLLEQDTPSFPVPPEGPGSGTLSASGSLEAGEPEIIPPITLKKMEGFVLTTPKMPYPQVAEVTRGIDYCKEILPETVDWWAGKWSQLTEEDCVMLGEFAGKYSPYLCVQNLIKTLQFDPYVIIPLEKATTKKNLKKPELGTGTSEIQPSNASGSNPN